MNKRYGLVISQERCIGCEACDMACRQENKGLARINVETIGGAKKDTPRGNFPDLTMNFLPQLCNHCENPPCVDSCPDEAIGKRADGIVLLDEDACTGCSICLEACPYGSIQMNEETGKAEKCNLCHHRIDKGELPFCVHCCEGQAMFFGDLGDAGSEVSKLAGKDESFVLMEEKGTKPGVVYLPVMEKRKI